MNNNSLSSRSRDPTLWNAYSKLWEITWSWKVYNGALYWIMGVADQESEKGTQIRQNSTISTSICYFEFNVLFFFIIHSFTFRYLHHFHLHSNSVIVFYCNSFKQIISASTIATSWIFSSWAIFPFYCYTCTCSVESDNYEAPQPDQTWLSNISRCFHLKPTTLTIATPSLRLSSLSNVHSSSRMTLASQFHAQ